MAATCACVARTHTAPAWRYPRARRVADLAKHPTATVPAASSSAAPPPPAKKAPPPTAQQLTVDKFAPWLAELRVQLRELGLGEMHLIDADGNPLDGSPP